MTFEIAFMMLVLVGALVVFTLELLPLEVTAFGLLAVLFTCGFVNAEQALTGLNNKAVVTIGAMFVLGHALVKTGILEVAADRLSREMGLQAWHVVGILLVTVSLLSGLLNNTAVVAIFIPLTMNLCHRFHISPSKVLIPLSYASIFGGTLTLIGTSTNLLVSAATEQAGQPPLRMFEFTQLGIVFVVVGLAYTLTLARPTLPSRAVVSSLTHKYRMRRYLSEVEVLQDSKLKGKTCVEIGLNRVYDITALAILRGKTRHTENIRNMQLRAHDTLIVRGTIDNLIRLRNEKGAALLSDIKLGERELSEGQVIAEALITPTSTLIGKTMEQVDFRRHYGAFVLAIRSHGATQHSKVAHTRLRVSDTLLLMAPPERLDELRRSNDMIVISELDLALKRGRFWLAPLLIIPLIVLLSAIGIMDIMEAAVLGAITLLILNVVTPQEAYRAIDWSVLLFIAAFVPVGLAMVETGTATFLASAILSISSWFPDPLGPYVALSTIYLVTSLLTQIISNNATALILPPIVLTIGAAMEIDPRPFIIAVCFAASAAFMTPIGYQTNMMVYAPGNYRFRDYLRFGVPLSLIFWLLASYLIPRFWPFQPITSY